MNYNSLYIQHLKYILFCCTLVSKCIQVGFLKYRSEIYLVVSVSGDISHSALRPVQGVVSVKQWVFSEVLHEEMLPWSVPLY